MKTHGYAAQAADKPLAPFTFERRALARTISRWRFSIAASATPTCTRPGTTGAGASTRWSPATRSSVGSSPSAARSPATRSATRSRSAAWWTAASIATSAARARSSSAATATRRPITTRIASPESGLTAAIPGISWSARNSRCGFPMDWTSRAPRRCSALASRRIPRCAPGMSARAAGSA